MQGARLTAWELHEAGIPVTLTTEAAAAAAMATRRVDAVVVSCDRVARNGDTANKVGTYAHAVVAAANSLPFYVAGPCRHSTGRSTAVTKSRSRSAIPRRYAGSPAW